MKSKKTFEYTDIPKEIRDALSDKLDGKGQNSYINYYPGDGYFKPLSEVKNMENILFYGKDTIDSPDVYVYEKGDDIAGDYFMEKGAKLCEDVLILINW